MSCLSIAPDDGNLITLDSYVIMSPSTLTGGQRIDFGVDPIGVGFSMTLSVYTISCEPVGGFLPNFQGYIIGT